MNKEMKEKMLKKYSDAFDKAIESAKKLGEAPKWVMPKSTGSGGIKILSTTKEFKVGDKVWYNKQIFTVSHVSKVFSKFVQIENDTTDIAVRLKDLTHWEPIVSPTVQNHEEHIKAHLAHLAHAAHLGNISYGGADGTLFNTNIEWVSKDELIPRKEKEFGHQCNCDSRDLFNYGCKCGGV